MKKEEIQKVQNIINATGELRDSANNVLSWDRRITIITALIQKDAIIDASLKIERGLDYMARCSING